MVSVEVGALERAHREAVAGLPGVRERYVRGLPPGTALFVKRGFPAADGSTEYMWATVTGWEGDQILAVLANAPARDVGVRLGDTVLCPVREVYDWLITHPDGRREGGFTTDGLG